jgi:hypothetical protein
MANAVDRVSLNTSFESNERINEQIERNIAYYADHVEEIDNRLEILNREWDIERILETQVATISILSMVFGVFGNRKWLFVPGLIGGFLLNHAIRGWAPPIPVLRRLGVRTQGEIERERYALKALRGDFDQLENSNKNSNITDISQRIIKAISN